MQIFHTAIPPPHWSCPLYFPRIARALRNTIRKTIQIFHTTKTLPPSCLVSIPRIVRTSSMGIGPQLHLTIEQPIKKYWLSVFLILSYRSIMARPLLTLPGWFEDFYWGVVADLLWAGWQYVKGSSATSTIVLLLAVLLASAWDCLAAHCVQFLLVNIGCFLAPKTKPKKSLTLKMCLLTCSQPLARRCLQQVTVESPTQQIVQRLYYQRH